MKSPAARLLVLTPARVTPSPLPKSMTASPKPLSAMLRDDPDALNARPKYLKTPYQHPCLLDFAQARSTY